MTAGGEVEGDMVSDDGGAAGVSDDSSDEGGASSITVTSTLFLGEGDLDCFQ